MISILKSSLNLGKQVSKQASPRQYLISRNAVTRFGYLSKASYTSLTTKFQDSYSRCKEELCQGSEFLRSYISQLSSNDKKLSRKDYLAFKRNLTSIDSIDILVQYLQPLTKDLHTLNQKKQKRIFKLIIQAEKSLLASTGNVLNHSKQALIEQESIVKRISSIKNFIADSVQNKNTLMNHQVSNASTIQSFYTLKESICNYQLKKLSRQQFALSSFQTLTYLAVPTLFYIFPYSSMLFLHPYVGETYYRFALLSHRQNQKTGILISLLLAGSLSLAFYKTYSDIYDIYEKKYLNRVNV